MTQGNSEYESERGRGRERKVATEGSGGGKCRREKWRDILGRKIGERNRKEGGVSIVPFET